MDKFESLKQTLRDLHKSSNLHKGLKILDRELKPGSDIRNEVTLQLSRCSDNEQQHEIGVRDEGTYINEKNKIRNAFLRLIDNLERYHLVDNFDENPVENLNPSLESTPVTSSQSNWGWLFSLFLIGVFVLSSVFGFITFKPDAPTVSEPTGNCDSLSLKNETLKNTIESNKNVIAVQKKSIESLQKKNKKSIDSLKIIIKSMPDWGNDVRTKQLRDDKALLDREIRRLDEELTQCRDTERNPKKDDYKYKLFVLNDLNCEATLELLDMSVRVDRGKETIVNNTLSYHVQDSAIAKEIKKLLGQYYKPINLEPRSKHKGELYFHNPKLK